MHCVCKHSLKLAFTKLLFYPSSLLQHTVCDSTR